MSATATLESILGPLTIRAARGAITEIRFGGEAVVADALPDPRGDDARLVERAREELDEYFARRRRAFDLPLRPEGTEFQRRVWDELRRIPYGEVISYGELARRIGNPSASRAVGAANGRNPIPVVIPCHRVIGASGALTGFGGGLPIKEALLRLEARQGSLFG